MNAGFSNLATLKSWLLTPAMRSGADYDSQIVAIGLGVAAQFDRFCNRKFARAVDDVFETSANRALILLDRYPVEAVTKIEVRDDLTIGWVDQGTVNNVLFNLRTEPGICEFAGYLGGSFSRIRITSTGGYFFEQLEPSDVGYPTAQPAGSTALPDDVQLAWRLQCELVWTQRDKLGIAIAEKPESRWNVPLSRVALLDDVKDKLQPYVRYQLT